MLMTLDDIRKQFQDNGPKTIGLLTKMHGKTQYQVHYAGDYPLSRLIDDSGRRWNKLPRLYALTDSNSDIIGFIQKKL